MRFLLLAVAMLAASSVQAADTVTYSYDALGRLTSSSTSGGPANNTIVTIAFDPSGNRTNYKVVQGGTGAPCTFTASADTYNSDEFSLYPYITRNTECSGSVTLAYSVTRVSGSGDFIVYEGNPGTVASFNPPSGSDMGRSIRVAANPNTVMGGDNLILNLHWSVASGNATITDADTQIMFCDDGWGC